MDYDTFEMFVPSKVYFRFNLTKLTRFIDSNEMLDDHK